MSGPPPITDPRHPLQMDLAAAEGHVRKWQRIVDSTHDDRKRAWARGHLAFHQGRRDALNLRIAERIKP